MRLFLSLALACLAANLPALPDVVILHDGSSYSGHLSSVPQIQFTGTNGVGFNFPVDTIQSLVFTPDNDTVTLRSGKSYTGRYAGGDHLSFLGAEGISYNFPVRDVASLVFTKGSRQVLAPASGGPAMVLPEGTEIAISTNEKIDSKRAEDGQLYSATISGDVADSAGKIAIPNGTPAKLVVRNIKSGGAVHTPELVLDLFSIQVNGREYRTVTTNVVESGRDSLGANKRTLEYTGGGTGLGALLGGVFGGGEGAGIGALAGAGGGALTQLFTRGKEIKVPAETTMRFRLDHTLVLRP